MNHLRAPGALALLLGAATGCNPFGPAETVPIDYYAVQAVPLVERPGAAAGLPPVRVSPVQAAIHLADRIVWRRADLQAGFYETRRWIDPPGPIVERALARELFERRGIPYGVTLDAWQVDVDLEAFDEVLEPAHVARVTARVALLDPTGAAHLVRTFDASRPVAGPGASALAQAMSAALGALVTEVGGAIEAALRR